MEAFGALFNLGVFIGIIVAFFWSLSALSELKQGQREILERLAGLETARATIPEQTAQISDNPDS